MPLSASETAVTAAWSRSVGVSSAGAGLWRSLSFVTLLLLTGIHLGLSVVEGRPALRPPERLFRQPSNAASVPRRHPDLIRIRHIMEYLWIPAASLARAAPSMNIHPQ